MFEKDEEFKRKNRKFKTKMSELNEIGEEQISQAMRKSYMSLLCMSSMYKFKKHRNLTVV